MTLSTIMAVLGLLPSPCCFHSVLLYAVAQLVEHRSWENVVIHFLFCHVKLCASSFPLHCSSSFSSVNGYMAIESGGYLYVNTFAH